MTPNLCIVSRESISLAWAKAFIEVMKPKVTEISPLVVTVDGLGDGPLIETSQIKERLDRELLNRRKFPTETVANTIFPSSLWNKTAEPDALYKRFKSAWPRIRKSKDNFRGHYFHRMIAFKPKDSPKEVNQLEHVIETFRRGNHRRSALQLSIFDPTRDHTHSRRQGFPCLQQVSFAPISKSELSVTGYYPTQTLFERAYGNYLGISRLGEFVATQLNMRLTRMTCIASVAYRGNITKGQLLNLTEDLKKTLSKIQEAA